MTLSKTEIRALVRFWNRYMPARKHYEALLKACQQGGKQCGCSEWLAYQETKQDCFNELVLTINEIRYTDFWRDVVMLHPEAVVDAIIRYRKLRTAEQEQRATEKAILAGQQQVKQQTKELARRKRNETRNKK